MDHYKITPALIQATMAYLEQRPYREVAPLIHEYGRIITEQNAAAAIKTHETDQKVS